MGKFSRGWHYFRDRAQRKEERQHFGLAWSVLAAFFLAGSVFLRSFHESDWLMKAFDWLSLAFFLIGAVAAYLALAVALRLPPHNPKNEMSICAIEWNLCLLGGTTCYKSGKGMGWTRPSARRTTLG
jgi:drug/metabolite transporter (DMT)-like permease